MTGANVSWLQNRLVYGNGNFVANDSYGNVFYATDGSASSSWNQTTIGGGAATSTSVYSAPVFNSTTNKFYVFKGIGSDRVQTVWETSNGSSWTSSQLIGTAVTSEGSRFRVWASLPPAAGFTSNYVGLHSANYSVLSAPYPTSSVLLITPTSQPAYIPTYSPTPRTTDLPSATAWYLTKPVRDSVVSTDRDALEITKSLTSPTLYAGSSEIVNIAVGKRNTDAVVAATDSARINSLFVRGAPFAVDTATAQDTLAREFGYGRPFTDQLIGDLDPFGNINTLDSRGILRMTNYADIEYLAEDYVGESRSFT